MRFYDVPIEEGEVVEGAESAETPEVLPESTDEAGATGEGGEEVPAE